MAPMRRNNFSRSNQREECGHEHHDGERIPRRRAESTTHEISSRTGLRRMNVRLFAIKASATERGNSLMRTLRATEHRPTKMTNFFPRNLAYRIVEIVVSAECGA